MKELLRHILILPARVAAASLLMLLVQACSSDNEPDMFPEVSYETTYTVCQLSVSTTEAPASRAAGYLGDDYDTGFDFENYIDIPNHNFRLYYFDSTNDTFLAELIVESIAPLETSTYSKTYSVKGKTPDTVENKSVKIVVLANWPEYPQTLTPGVTTISDFWNYTYEFNKESMKLSADVLVPLFGITDAKTVIFDRGGITNVGTIHMLRAYAKVEVRSGASNVYPIESVKLHRYNTRGFCMANVSSQAEYVKGSSAHDYTSSAWIPSGCESSETIDFMPNVSGNWVAYIPEYKNLASDGSLRPDGERTTIEVRYSNYSSTEVTEFKDYTVEFADYDTNVTPNKPETYHDVMRNNWYIFTLTKKKYTLDVEVDVIPYSTVDLDPIFGLEPSYDTPEELYIVGHLFNVPFAPDTGTKLTYDPVAKIFYGDVEITGPFWFATGLNTELEPERFYSHGNQFGSRYGGTISYNFGMYITQLDDPKPLTLSGNTSKGYYKVVVDWDQMHVSLYEANPAMPEELYVVGNIGGEAFATDKGVKLTRDAGTNIFYADVEITGEFWLAASLSDNSDNFYSHGNQYGPATNSLLDFESPQLFNSNDEPGHFYFDTYTPGKKYHLTVNWETMTVVAEPM